MHFFPAVALRAEVRGGGLQGAVDTPNWHNGSFPSSFYPRGMCPGGVTVEAGTDPEAVRGLRRRGHDVTVGEPWSEGRLCAVARDPEAGCCPRPPTCWACRGTPWGAEQPRPRRDQVVGSALRHDWLEA